MSGHNGTSLYNVLKIPLRAVKKSTLKIIKYFYYRIPLSQSMKIQIMECCFLKIPWLFRGLPSYELRQAIKAGHISDSSTATDFLRSRMLWNLMLPAKIINRVKEFSAREVDVIIPVYRGLDQTRRCINSVLNSTLSTSYRLIVINDASPEAEINEYLSSFKNNRQILIIENTQNMGFTATVNRGMSLSDKNDVLLLNSDAEVANDWLDKLQSHAYTDTRIGSVTPFSNNATICSYPSLNGMKKLPDGENTEFLDKAFFSANQGRNIKIPTAVGFCMYIRRDCLNEVGLFDVEAFGKGYGEENDFCLRATAKGWKHLLAADTFVFHEGEVSFQSSSNPRKERAMSIMRERYPFYESEVVKHIANDEAYPLRVAATAARFKNSKQPVVLHILHALGGGTEKHVNELCKAYSGQAKMLILTPPAVYLGKPTLQLRSTDPVDNLDIKLPSSNIDFLSSFFQSFGISHIHIHHTLGYQLDLEHLVKKMGVGFYLTVHDYNLICPRINMMPVGQNYCGEPEPSSCNKCLSVNYPQGAGDIIWWREKHAWLFKDASVVICPSQDVFNRCQKYFPDVAYRVVPHENVKFENYYDIEVPVLSKSDPLRVAILGALSLHKGSELIYEAVAYAKKNKSPVKFQLIGWSDINFQFKSSSFFSETGPYKEDELAEKIKVFDPHLILFPSPCPETYSFTLTSAIKSRRPIMVSDLGALPERVASRPWTWLMGSDISATELINKLSEIREKHFYTRTKPHSFKIASGDMIICDETKFYESEYLALSKKDVTKDVFDIRKPGKITVLVLIENTSTQPSPCAYIRLILPLIRERGEKLDLRWVISEQITSYVADVLICQRTTVSSIIDINKIANHCQKNNIRIVYDLDDMLFALPEEHPEHAIYAEKSGAVFRWLHEADEVWVSTKSLQQQIAHINSNTRVVANYLDDNLWKTNITSTITKIEKNFPVRLLYMGTKTHNADFELVKNMLKMLKKEFGNKLEIYSIGITVDLKSESWYHTIRLPKEMAGDYPSFVNWILKLPKFDIGIAPLIDNEFNRCKSEIKFFDYSALGLVTVASDLNGYALIRNGENGFRTQNTDESWYKVLKTLIEDSKLRKQIQRTALSEVFTNYGFESIAGYRTQLLTSLLSKNDKEV